MFFLLNSRATLEYFHLFFLWKNLMNSTLWSMYVYKHKWFLLSLFYMSFYTSFFSKRSKTKFFLFEFKWEWNKWTCSWEHQDGNNNNDNNNNKTTLVMVQNRKTKDKLSWWLFVVTFFLFTDWLMLFERQKKSHHPLVGVFMKKKSHLDSSLILLWDFDNYLWEKYAVLPTFSIIIVKVSKPPR